MEDRAVGRLDVLNELRKALERDELVAHYQPIVNLETGEVVAAEALMRWDRPGHGLVPPLDFIPLAEETGLIAADGRLDPQGGLHAGARMARHGGAPDVRVGVNVSARQLIDPDFERMVSRTLAETGLEPDGLVLEVTESSVMQNPEVTIPKLDRIVGTRRAALARRLRRGLLVAQPSPAPARPRAQDRPAVRQGARGPRGRSRGSCAASSSWRTASGCDWWPRGSRCPSSARRCALGCPLGQGFLFARPLELPAFRALLREQQRSPVG